MRGNRSDGAKCHAASIRGFSMLAMRDKPSPLAPRALSPAKPRRMSALPRLVAGGAVSALCSTKGKAAAESAAAQLNAAKRRLKFPQ